jgi:phytoene dehydrogenase-like protein
LRISKSNIYARGMPLDAVVVGAGPNGLAAAITIAQTGRKVLVLEAAASIGGGCRSAELTLPGFVHDVCSAVHPFAVASPFFRTLPLASYGLEWIEPEAMLAHPFANGQAAIVYRSVEHTAAGLGEDRDRYRQLYQPLIDDWSKLESTVLGPLRWPAHPIAAALFGLRALGAVEPLARRVFKTETARGLLAGTAAHSMLPLDRRPTAGIALVLTLLAHVVGWVIPRGGSQRIADALAAYLRSLGGEIETSTPVTTIDEIPAARAVLCDLSPAPLLRIAGHRLSALYKRALSRYRYGMGVFKMDWALDAPIPWRNAACSRAGTVHLGGTLSEIARSEREIWNGGATERPFVLIAQPTLFDPSRAPAGRHVGWAYCHVPHGSTVDMSTRIEQQIERYAPGFRDRILARSVMSPSDLERHNPNLVGGDIAAGVVDLWQLFRRPTWRTYSTPVKGVYICSASTPPGIGVHGMCGYLAAKRALKDVLEA